MAKINSTISVVIPCYNYGKYLKRCINSVLNQTRKPQEIWVIDDCSLDNTKEVVKFYKDKIKYFRNKKNLGAAKSHNVGIKKSSGDYIFCLDADDWVGPTLLQKEAEILDSYPQIGLVYSQSYSVYSSKKIILRVPDPPGMLSYIGGKKDFFRLLRGDFIPANTMLIRKKVYQKVGLYDPKVYCRSDYEMKIRIAKEFPLAYLAQPLGYYRGIHGQNLHMRQIWDQSFEWELSYILKKHFSGKLSQSMSEIKKEAYYRFHLSVSLANLAKNRWSEVFRHWFSALLIKPFSILTWSTIQPLVLCFKRAVFSLFDLIRTFFYTLRYGF